MNAAIVFRQTQWRRFIQQRMELTFSGRPNKKEKERNALEKNLFAIAGIDLMSLTSQHDRTHLRDEQKSTNDVQRMKKIQWQLLNLVKLWKKITPSISVKYGLETQVLPGWVPCWTQPAWNSAPEHSGPSASSGLGFDSPLLGCVPAAPDDADRYRRRRRRRRCCSVLTLLSVDTRKDREITRLTTLTGPRNLRLKTHFGSRL